jgi:dihydrofolate reductase
VTGVVWHTTMSLDGFITGPDDAMEWAFERGEPSGLADEVMETTGAILAGRRWHDVATERYGGRQGIYGGRWDGRVFVLTHHPPADPDDPEITFLTAGVEAALDTAKAAAGPGKNVEVFGADVARQCIEAGLLDELVVHIVPVMLGDGVRLYGAPGVPRVDLEQLALEDSGRQVSLRYRVSRR